MNKLIAALEKIRDMHDGLVCDMGQTTVEICDAALSEHRAEPSADVVARLGKLATHIEGLDSGSGDAKLIREAIAAMQKGE